MEQEIEKLSFIKAKKKKLKEKHNKRMKKWNKKRKKVYRKIIEIERVRCNKDRARFCANIQLSKLPNLLIKKRPAPIENIQEITLLRNSVFQLDDVFKLIVLYLGPMEFFIFSRASKQLFGLLNRAFYQWSIQFLERIGQETEITAFPQRLKEAYRPLLNSVYQHKFIKLETFLYRCLHLVYAIFVIYRPQQFLDVVYLDKASRIPAQHARTTIFIYNHIESELKHMNEYNLLCGKAYYEMMKKNIEGRFNDKYGISLPEPTNSLDHFHYKDLNKLNLSSISSKTVYHNSALFFMNVKEGEEEINIMPLKDQQLRVLSMRVPSEKYPRTWKGYYFCDEYECRLKIMSRLPPLPSILNLMRDIQTLLNIV